MAAVGNKSMIDSQELCYRLDTALAGGPCFMTSSVQDLSGTDNKEPDIGYELEIFPRRISDLREKVLALQQKSGSPNADTQAMREELGGYVQSLRGLQVRITEFTGKVASPEKQAGLEDASRRIAELFPTCLDCLHSIEPSPASAWSVGRLWSHVQSYLWTAPKPNAVEELRKAFPVDA